jgi:hypothetical protein
METSLLTALIGSETGKMQLAFAARLASMNTDNASSITQLVGAAQQSFNSLANVAAGIGTNANVSC